MKALLALFCFLLTTPAFANPEGLFADASDIARFGTAAASDAKLLEAARKADPRFTQGGATFQSGLHLSGSPSRDKKGLIYEASALMKDSLGRNFYRKFEVTIGGALRGVTDVRIVTDIDLAKMQFSASVGLIDRQLLLEDSANNIMLVFPLGVGGVDPSVMGDHYRLLTPAFRNAYLDRKNVTPARTQPAYYRGRPFMPITTSSGSVTAIAFHISILSDETAEQKGLNYLVRGFESHGCMRMREKDLLELFTILMQGAGEKISLNVDSFVWNKNSSGQRDRSMGAAADVHPYPTNDSSYMRVTYFPEAPHYKRDETEHLVIMDRAQGSPDLAALSGGIISSMDGAESDSNRDSDLLNSQYPMP